MSAIYQCDKCNRKFASERGLKTHDRLHSVDSDKCYDEKYKAKRIANTKSVRLHREMNPKMRFDQLETDIKDAVREAVIMEKYMRDVLGLEAPSLKEKLKEYTDVPIKF